MQRNSKSPHKTWRRLSMTWGEIWFHEICWQNSTLQLRHCLGFGPCWRLHKAGVFETQAHMEPKISTNRDDMLSTRWMNIGNSIYYMCILCTRKKETMLENIHSGGQALRSPVSNMSRCLSVGWKKMIARRTCKSVGFLLERNTYKSHKSKSNRRLI